MLELPGIQSPQLKFPLLQLVKHGQAQHGLRNGDYQRYRHYCTAKLRRLYKSLKFLHGRGKYVHKQIQSSNVVDVRHLHIVLYLAERAWSYAMDIKHSPKGMNTRQHYHLIRRLRKAEKWADLLEQLCNEKSDPHTALEATAYSSSMKGTLLLECESNWELALHKFKTSRAVYEELGKYGDVENQIICRERVEELEPSIRYCLYKMGRSDVHASELLSDISHLDVLQEKLQVVMEEAKSRLAMSTTSLNWLGHAFPVKNEKTRVCILKVQELEKDLGTAFDASNAEKRITLYDKVLICYQDAKRHIGDDLAMVGNAEDVRDDLIQLNNAVSSILLQRTIQRNQLLAAVAKNRLNCHQQMPKGDKLAKPEDLVQLYSLLVQNVSDLSDWTTSGRELNAEELFFAKELSVQQHLFNAERCFYLGQSYSIMEKYAEAYALFQRASEYTRSALKDINQLGSSNSDQAIAHELNELAVRCRAQCCLAHAAAVTQVAKDESQMETGMASISLDQQELGYLIDHLDEFDEFVGGPGSKDQPRIFRIPPHLRAIPCRPIVFDTALHLIEFPSLDARLKKEEKKKGLFGKWW